MLLSGKTKRAFSPLNATCQRQSEREKDLKWITSFFAMQPEVDPRRELVLVDRSSAKC